jgi:hypothetical protein
VAAVSEQATPGDEREARPGALVAAVVIAVLEAVALTAYAVGIGISALRNPGGIAAAPAEIVLYVVFAAGLLAIARGLWGRRSAARTPFGVAQLFGLVVGWTLTQGDGDLVHRIGYVVLAVSVVGIAVVMSPAVGEALDS